MSIGCPATQGKASKDRVERDQAGYISRITKTIAIQRGNANCILNCLQEARQVADDSGEDEAASQQL
jgi:hypothetical protein